MSVLNAGYWQTQAGNATTAPGIGRYQLDSFTNPTLLAVSVTDADGHTYPLSIDPGFLIVELGSNDSQNYQVWEVVSVVDNVTWKQFSIQVTEAGTAFSAPGTNQSWLLQAFPASTSESGGMLAQYLLDGETVTGLGPVVNLGEMCSHKSVQAFTDNDSTTFVVRLEGSMDGNNWFPFGQILGDDVVRSENQHTLQYVRAALDEVSGGAVSVMISWAP